MNHEWLEQDSATQNVAGDLINRTIILGTKVQSYSMVVVAIYVVNK